MTILVWNNTTENEECERVYNNVKLIKASKNFNCYEILLEDGTCKLVNIDKYYIEVI